MKLLQVHIEGFRNIASATVNLDSDVTTLVSTNSYGKSNVMEAVSFAADFLQASPEMKTSMMAWVLGVPLNKANASRNFAADFLFETEINGEAYFVQYGFEFVWIKNKGGKKIVKETLDVRQKGKHQKNNRLINRTEKALYKSSETGRCSSVMKLTDCELLINRMLLMEELYYFPIVKELNDFRVYVERHFDASELYMRNPIVIKGRDELDIDNISDIPRLTYILKKKHPDKYSMLQDAFMQLFPNISAIDVKEIDVGEHHELTVAEDAPYTLSNKVYSLYVQDRNLNQPLNFMSLSDGAKRVFLMLTCTTIADIKGYTLIALEEPENSIHPGLLQSYLNIMVQLAGKCRIMIASHSPYILQYVNTEGIYIGKPNEEGLAEFSRISKRKIASLIKDAGDNGGSVGDYIFDLLSGGEDDTEVLLNYLED